MLTPYFLENAPRRLVELYSEVEADIIADMAKRLVKMDFIPSAEWQFKKLTEMGFVHNEIVEKLSKALKVSKKEIEALMRDSGVQSIAADSQIYRKAGLDPPLLAASPTMRAVLQSGIDNTKGLFDNLTRTTADTATKQFEHALDRAWLNVTSGAFDYNSAIRMAIKDLTEKGLASITYPSGHTDHLDVAVRRAVVTGVNQTSLRMQDALADEMETDLVDVTAHAGARNAGKGPANHESWQGKRYSRSGTHPKYPSLREVTGYGTGAGLGGWNCRHNMFPAWDGMAPLYDQDDLDDMTAEKYEYNGKKMTEYEASQKQRYIERNIRKYKREFVGMEAAGQPSDEAVSKLAKWRGIHKDFLEQTGLKNQYARQEVAGFGRSEATRAQKAYANILKNPQEAVTMKAVSGARITNPSGEAAAKHANLYYESVRKMTTDVERIAKSTGFSKEDIQATKNYLFIDKQDLGGLTPQRFDPDFAIAQSWQRLMSGKQLPHDLTLLHHEQMERTLVTAGMPQDESHRLASQKFNYSKEVTEYYAALAQRKNSK